jgi:integrase
MRVFLRGKVYYAQFYDANGERQTKTTRCRDYQAAVRVARRFEREAADPSQAREETLVRALNELLLVSEQRMKDGEISSATYDYVADRIKSIGTAVDVIPEGEAEAVLPRRLADLAARHIDAYIRFRRSHVANVRTGKLVSANTVKKELVVLGQALAIAQRREWWAGSIDALMPRDFKPDYKPRTRYLTRPELDALLASLPPRRAQQIAFMVATGARLSESERALGHDVTADRVWLRGTKTDAAPRFVPIVLPWQVDLLATAQGRQGALHEPWLKLVRDLHLRCDKLGIERCSPNDLRRTFAHWMKAAGLSDELVAGLLGHTTSQMVKRVYGKRDGGELEAAIRGALGCTTGVSATSESPGPSEAPNLQKCPVFGSSCWTRTSDPVVNSQPYSRVVSARWVGYCSAGVNGAEARLGELRGLRQGLAGLGGVWDVAADA